jgi:guanylate kinase
MPDSMKRSKPGRIVIISSPSGGGKTSICRRLLSPVRRKQGWRFSISYTTRKKRPGERNGREYHFVTEDVFTELRKADFFAEAFRVHLYSYGTPRKPLEEVKRTGGVMLLDVDVQGAFRLKKEFPQAITVFILPPSKRELQRRLRRRGTETKEQLKVRRETAREEMKLYKRFEYTVINRDLEQAVAEVLAIVDSHHCRTEKLDQEQIRMITV